MNKTEQNSKSCPRPEIAAFLDGELTLREELELEIHIEKCSSCDSELRRQKSFLNALNSSFNEEKEFVVPSNFTKTVVAAAESRVSGLRRPRERFNALLVCASLFLLVVLGAGSQSAETLENSGSFFEKIAAVANLAVRFVYDLAFGITVILRSLCAEFIFKSEAANSFLLILLITSAFIFVRAMLRCKQV